MTRKTAAGTARTTRPRSGSMSWAQSFRDMVVAAINKGQLPVLGVLFVVLLFIFKLPEERIGDLARDLLMHLIDGSLGGYLLAVVFGSSWFFHAKAMRRSFSSEVDRIGREKSELQDQLAKIDFKRGDQK